MSSLFIIYMFLKELHHETPQNVSQRQQEAVLQNRQPYAQEEHPRCEHCHARRHSSVNDALLQAAKRLQGPITDQERKAQDRLFDVHRLP
ncbi:MAG: hypothetical protein [Microviridae sp.]|nr:MAG: hypothetical protein [Microviridae sp.]